LVLAHTIDDVTTQIIDDVRGSNIDYTYSNLISKHYLWSYIIDPSLFNYNKNGNNNNNNIDSTNINNNPFDYNLNLSRVKLSNESHDIDIDRPRRMSNDLHQSISTRYLSIYLKTLIKT
jgi:hypothetical protein